jgi:thioredoxin reductase (NADPH)
MQKGGGRTPTPRLTDDDIALFRANGRARQVTPGEYLYREGDLTYDFYVVVNAEVEILVEVDGDQHVVVRMEPGRFLGEFNMLTGTRVLSRRGWPRQGR